MNNTIKHLSDSDLPFLKKLLKVFAEAFHELETYQGALPTDEYLQTLLRKQYFIALVVSRSG